MPALRTLFNPTLFSKPQPTAGSSKKFGHYETLEARQLLAGDIDVFSQFGSITLYGDRLDNAVEIRTNADGDVVVVGLDETTINGSSDPFVAVQGDTISRNIRAYLGRGNDSILIEGVNVGNSVYVYGQSGDDAVGLLRTDVGNDVVVSGGRGELAFSLDISMVANDLRVYGGRHDDVLAIDESTVGGATYVSTRGGDDTLIVRNSEHWHRVTILTGRGDDFVAVVNTEITDRVFTALGSGHDELLIDDSTLHDRVWALGGFGKDVLEVTDSSDLSNARTHIFSMRGGEIADAETRIEEAIQTLVSAGARRPTLLELATGASHLTTLVDLLVDNGLVEALQSSNPPLTVFAPTNEAFNTFLNDFPTFPSSLTVTDVLLFHVSLGAVDAATLVRQDSVETLLTESFTVEQHGAVLLDNRAGLIATDLRARDGIVHLIDAVLTPSALDTTP